MYIFILHCLGHFSPFKMVPNLCNFIGNFRNYSLFPSPTMNNWSGSFLRTFSL